MPQPRRIVRKTPTAARTDLVLPAQQKKSHGRAPILQDLDSDSDADTPPFSNSSQHLTSSRLVQKFFATKLRSFEMYFPFFFFHSLSHLAFVCRVVAAIRVTVTAARRHVVVAAHLRITIAVLGTRRFGVSCSPLLPDFHHFGASPMAALLTVRLGASLAGFSTASTPPV